VQGTPATTALRQAAPTTPLVFVNVTDPISTGLVSSLAHPGGNITGFTNYEFSMGGKWLEILREIAPGITRVAVVFNPDNPVMPGNVHSIDAAGPTLGIQVAARPARNAEEFERTIRASASEPNSGLLVLLDFVTLAHRELIIRLATRYRLPTGYGLRVFATSGGLFSYGVDPIDLFRRGASYVDRILKGAKPADLPVQQPNKFQLVINLKAAAALGLEVPPTLLARADEVIE
jgi:putative ABC transport system substrate-binding protein